ncbi:Ubiquitin carboxyl-terminal hydrolase [Aphelenchoides fujianensis]|nr:Ubiquitin carboxyl-terminal hydrolase [Aphelenchoides fujianensis]
MELSGVPPQMVGGMAYQNPSAEVLYEDDEHDDSIPAIQKVTKKNNQLPLHGSDTTMNLNPVVYENIVPNYLIEVLDFQQATDEIYYNCAAWVAGGVITSAFCIMYKLFTLGLTRKQLVSMINNEQSVYVRGIGFLYIRFTQPPADLWKWFEPYLDDQEEIDPRSGGGEKMTVGQLLRQMLTKLDWYGTLFPRIPVPIQKEIAQKLKDRTRGPNWTGDAKRNGRPQPDAAAPSGSSSSSRKRTRCSHHLRHHHCAKHRKKCPSKAKRQRAEKEAASLPQLSTNEMASAGDWTLIESDPGVFTELIGGFGVEGVQVEELYTLDFEQLNDFKPVYGLIFLFKYRPGEEHGGKLVENGKDVYFAQQVINNACATQAIVNLLLNLDRSKITLGPILENFRAFSEDLDPASRGLCLSNSQEIRTVHNSFARANFLEIEEPKTGKGDAFHFITYLDGLKPAPIDLGAIPDGKEWLDVVREELVDPHRKARHNYTPFIVELLKLLAKEGKLVPLVEKAAEEEEKRASAKKETVG